MFENIIEQGAVVQIENDIRSGCLAPSMLFFGPPETGKGSTALELARVLSCETDASWKCSCSSCERHRHLQHNDLLILGNRPFLAEISACNSGFLSNPSNQNVKMLFIRSLRKLQIRFSSIVTEDDSNLKKYYPALQSIEEGLSDLLFLNTAAASKDELAKLCGSLEKNARSLADEISGVIPANRIRRASYWCRLAPNGKRKTLLIENAQNMREEGRNSLLKLLEEPPSGVNIILTTPRKESIISTILSRLRPYRFLKRSAQGEREVLRRIFQYSSEKEVFTAGNSLVSAYMESFLQHNTEKLYPLAAWFVVSLARISAACIKRNGSLIPSFINALGERYSSIAAAAGFERSLKIEAVVKTLLAKSGNFEETSFSGFLKMCLEMIYAVSRETDDPYHIAYNDLIKKYFNEAQTAAEVLNQSIALSLEGLLYRLKTGFLNASRGVRYG
jgi:DNA polymerase-3 subunit gamma/tau